MNYEKNLPIVSDAIVSLQKAEKIMLERKADDIENLPALRGDDEPDVHVSNALQLLKDDYEWVK